MLHSLYVKNLALIDEVEIEFGEGLNILTGETGAGKSIIIGSIHLALGGRYTKDILRKGSKFGLVELVFLLDDKKQMKRLEDLDVFAEDGCVTLSRKLMEGRSVCKINGETVSMALVKEVADILIDIHGQHEHQSLTQKTYQLHLLDAFAKQYSAPALKNVADCYAEYRKIEGEWKKANLNEAERKKEADFISYEISQIQEADVKPGEDEALEEEFQKMSHAGKIVEQVSEASMNIEGGQGNSVSDGVEAALRSLLSISQYDEKAKQLCDQLGELEGLLNDFVRDLSDYRESLEFSEERFYEVEERLNVINRLKTRYGTSIPDILSYMKEKEKRLEILADYDVYLADLENKKEEKKQEVYQMAEQLRQIRKEQASILEKEIVKGLQELNFLDVQFSIAFHELEQVTSNGADEICFMISMNPGEPLRPLHEVASGGELSRIMLVIKTVMAEKDEIETLIFDEIDVGISGRTAQKVSEKMAQIGKVHQVLCITHLAQIAAMADVHFEIKKNVQNGMTTTSIQKLSETEEIQELARIISGAQMTDTVLDNAREMKNLANSIKQSLKK